MRQLSKRTQYSLRALYALSRDYHRGPRLIQDLADAEAIPKKFLEQILLDLKNKGLVSSKKGRGGGYALAKPPEQVTLGAVIRLVEGPLAPVPCASETSFQQCEECEEARTCGTSIVMREVRDAMAAILDRTTLAMVCRKVDEARAERQEQGAFMYYI